MASRAIIGKVDGQGHGQAIYLGHDGCPDQAGDALLEHYADEDRIDRLMRMGSVTRLEPTPEESDTYFRDHGQLWELGTLPAPGASAAGSLYWPRDKSANGRPAAAGPFQS